MDTHTIRAANETASLICNRLRIFGAYAREAAISVNNFIREYNQYG